MKKELNRIKAANIKYMVCDPGKKVTKIPDGGGLYLWIYPNGSKQWYFHYRYNGKARDYYLGTWNKTTAEAARKKRDECIKALSEGIDPKNYFNQIKKDNIAKYENTFKAIAERWLETRKKKVAEITFSNDLARLNKDIYPAIGDKPIKSVTKEDIRKIISKVEIRTVKGGGTNRRILNEIINIFDYANVFDICENNPARPLINFIRPATKTHRAAITHDMKEFGEFLRALDNSEEYRTPSVFYSLKLSVLVAARSGDIVKMRWNEIDFKKAEWRYTVSKINREFVAPLSRQAIEILKKMKDLYYGGLDSLVFPSPKGVNIPLSNNAFPQFIKGIGFKGKQSQHGLRATMQTQLLELGYPKDWTEIALTHDIAKYGGAYDRATYIDQRRKMMQAWADYIDEIKKPGADYEALKKKYTFSG